MIDNNQNNNQRPDYYTRTGQKVGDFFFGFIGSFILFIILSFAVGYFAKGFLPITIQFVATIIVLAILTRFYFKINRRFVAIGIILSLLIPILVYGSCLSLFYAFNTGGL